MSSAKPVTFDLTTLPATPKVAKVGSSLNSKTGLKHFKTTPNSAFRPVVDPRVANPYNMKHYHSFHMFCSMIVEERADRAREKSYPTVQQTVQDHVELINRIGLDETVTLIQQYLSSDFIHSEFVVLLQQQFAPVPEILTNGVINQYVILQAQFHNMVVKSMIDNSTAFGQYCEVISSLEKISYTIRDLSRRMSMHTSDDARYIAQETVSSLQKQYINILDTGHLEFV